MAAFQVGVRLFSRFHAVQKIAHVLYVLIFRVARSVLGWFRPIFLGRLGDGLWAADRMTTDNPRDDVRGILFLVRLDLKAVASESHRSLVAEKGDAAHAGLRVTGGGFAELANGLEPGVLDDGVLHIRHFA